MVSLKNNKEKLNTQLIFCKRSFTNFTIVGDIVLPEKFFAHLQPNKLLSPSYLQDEKFYRHKASYKFWLRCRRFYFFCFPFILLYKFLKWAILITSCTAAIVLCFGALFIHIIHGDFLYWPRFAYNEVTLFWVFKYVLPLLTVFFCASRWVVVNWHFPDSYKEGRAKYYDKYKREIQWELDHFDDPDSGWILHRSFCLFYEVGYEKGQIMAEIAREERKKYKKLSFFGKLKYYYYEYTTIIHNSILYEYQQVPEYRELDEDGLSI